MDRYLIYRCNSSTQYEYLGSAHFKESAIAFANSIPKSIVVFDGGSIFKTIVYENQ